MRTKKNTTTAMQLPGALALATAGASVASGATVQITFANNYVANTANGGLTNFQGDLTGDMIPEIMGSVGEFGNVAFVKSMAGDQVLGGAVYGGGGYSASVGMTILRGTVEVVVRSVAPVAFTDTRVNSGLLTYGWLDMTATSSPLERKISIHRLIFDDASVDGPDSWPLSSSAYTEWSAVPEPSSLGLLALGAGGLLARRRRAKAA